MFPIQLPLEDGRPDGTVSDDTSNSSFHDYERFVPVSPEDCDQFLSANVNKNTKHKTNSNVNLFYLWARQNLEMRKIQENSATMLDSPVLHFNWKKKTFQQLNWTVY